VRVRGPRVVGSTDERTRARARPPRVSHATRDAEVEDRRSVGAAVAQEDIGRLEVAVNDLARVRDGQPAGEIADHPEALAQREPATMQPHREVLAFEPLHREERLVAAHHSVRDVANDPRMLELGEDFHLAFEALAVVVRIEQLQRDLTRCLEIDRSVHGAHAAGADTLDELEALADHRLRTHGRHGSYERIAVMLGPRCPTARSSLLRPTSSRPDIS
jgi:hypothetical protein